MNGTEQVMPVAIPQPPNSKILVRDVSIDDAAITVTLDGQICYQSVPSLQAFLVQQFTDHGPRCLMLDMRKVTFVDSQGLALLIALYKTCASKGSGLSLLGASPHVQSLIGLTRLDRFIKMV